MERDRGYITETTVAQEMSYLQVVASSWISRQPNISEELANHHRKLLAQMGQDSPLVRAQIEHVAGLEDMELDDERYRLFSQRRRR